MANISTDLAGARTSTRKRASFLEQLIYTVNHAASTPF